MWFRPFRSLVINMITINVFRGELRRRVPRSPQRVLRRARMFKKQDVCWEKLSRNSGTGWKECYNQQRLKPVKWPQRFADLTVSGCSSLKCNRSSLYFTNTSNSTRASQCMSPPDTCLICYLITYIIMKFSLCHIVGGPHW